VTGPTIRATWPRRRVDDPDHAILARHQLTNGTGTVDPRPDRMNEFYDGSTRPPYMKHLEDRLAPTASPSADRQQQRHVQQRGRALDIDGPDSYPQGFNCSNPTQWSGLPDISYDHPAGKPLYTRSSRWVVRPVGGRAHKCRTLTA